MMIKSSINQEHPTTQPSEEGLLERMRRKYGHHYKFKRILGTGAFCTVYEAIERHSKERMAVKVISK